MFSVLFKVLLVDDDEDYFVITRDLLSEITESKFVINWQRTYEAGLAAVRCNGHDVCLVDYRLGARNGLELMREAIAAGCESPMILLTGQGDPEVDIEATKIGAADYLVKGEIDARSLERSIRYAVEKARTLASLRESQRTLLTINEDLKNKNEQLKNAQLTLMNADKMETVGRLAAGVAHEVKNPLTVISMGIEYLSTDLPDNGDANLKTILGEMKRSVQRADKIIHGLLDFSASSRWDVKDEDLNSIIDQSLQLVRHEFLKSHVDVSRELSGGLPRLKLNQTKMEQALINLFINATHAMPMGGTLTVRSRGLKPNDQNGAEKEPARKVMIEVADTGTGLPPEILPKLFVPFFTTKSAGVGTGLGLCVVKNIVELHGGTFTIANRPEGGVQATITFKVEKEEREENTL